jgi:hypothetical protein
MVNNELIGFLVISLGVGFFYGYNFRKLNEKFSFKMFFALFLPLAGLFAIYNNSSPFVFIIGLNLLIIGIFYNLSYLGIMLVKKARSSRIITQDKGDELTLEEAEEKDEENPEEK